MRLMLSTVEAFSLILIPFFGHIHGVVADEGYLYCVSEIRPNSSVAAFVDSIASKPGTHNRPVDHCESTSNACFALWEYKQDEFGNFTPVVLRKGCWNPSDKDACESDTCSGGLRSFSQARQNLSFCCCKGNMCNLSVNYTFEFARDEMEGVTTVFVAEPNGPNVVFCILGAGVVILVAGIVAILHQLCKGQKKANSKSSLDSEERHSLMECFDTKDLKILETIGHGRYGTVWRGTITDDRDLAVKIFTPQSQSYFFNERDIYCLPLIDHPNIVGYLGCDERLTPNEFVEHRIFLNYHPIGCVQDYLRNNSIDWSVFCKMGQSVSRGLSHLHTYIKKGDIVKPAVAHRDINSRNILVKSDLSLCICDMGFAMQINGAHYVFSGEQQHAETESLTDVGTLRYMAPEVLEGAVNLRECEAALKQIDVYALSLVLWELASRCHDMYLSSQKVPAYKMPFEAELGPHIDFERLQNLVSRLKARPLFSEFWRENNPALRLLRETIEDCWDADAEARLTAVCVEERFTEMVTLWDRFKAHGTGLQGFGNESLSDTVITRNSFNENQKSFQLGRSPCNTSDNTGSSSVTTVDVALMENHNIQPREFDKNFNNEYPWMPQLQPYQGRNPCMERNTLSADDSDDLSAIGNALVPKSVKQANIAQSEIDRNSRVQSSTTDTNSSGTAHRILNPIPYVQNVVVEPKILNIPRQEEPKQNGNVVSWLLGAMGKKAPSGRIPVVAGNSSSSHRKQVSSDTKESNSSERSVQNVCVSSIPSFNTAVPVGAVSVPLVVHVPVHEPETYATCDPEKFAGLEKYQEVLPLLEQVVIDRNVNVA